MVLKKKDNTSSTNYSSHKGGKKKSRKKLKDTKRKQVNLKIKGLESNGRLVSHLRYLVEEMIRCRCEMGVDDELVYCQEVIDDNLTCIDKHPLDCEQELDQAIDGITSTKRDDAKSIHTDLIIGSLDKLFKISATPVPDLPKREEDIVVEQIFELVNQLVVEKFQNAKLGYMETLTQQGVLVTEREAEDAVLQSSSTQIDLIPTEEEIFEIAKQYKKRALKFLTRRAQIGAKSMERQIHDIVVETDFSDEILKFIDDFDSYPYAIMRLGSHLPFTRRTWNGNTWVWEQQMLPVAKRVSPFDFFWTPDTTEINNGTALADRLRLRRSDLEGMWNFETNKDVKANIDECIHMCNQFNSWREWDDDRFLGGTKENVYDDKDRGEWKAASSVPVFRIHTLLDNCILEEMGLEVTGKKKLAQYEIEAWLLNEKIIRFKVYDPRGHRRPYAKASFRDLPGRFHGKSLPQILKPLELEIRSVTRSMLLNIGYSSAPIFMRDETAFNVDEDELPDIITPGDNLNVRGYVGRNIKPVEIVTIPNNANQLRGLLNDLYSQADIKSQIPRLLTGQGGLNSSIRSASMLATQVNSASKNLKRQIWMIAANVIKPYIQEVFDWYMINGDDESAKVDADVAIGSIEKLVNREFLLNHIQNLIQYLAPYVGQGVIPPSVIQELMFTLLSETGISEDSNNAEILEELQGTVNDVTSNLPVTSGSGNVQLDARSNFQSIDTGSL